jgi:uncharacterized OB-fold protein
MTYLPEDLASPIPTLDNQAWWDACNRRELVFQRCRGCGELRHPPGPVCRRCHGFDCEWQPSRGRGRVYSFTWVHHVYLPSLQDRVPYNVSIVTLDDARGVRLVTNVIDVTAAELTIGLPVELAWEAAGEQTLPRFRRA